MSPPQAAAKSKVGQAKSKAGRKVRTSKKKTSKNIQVVDLDDSTELSDLGSGSDREGNGNGSDEESAEGMDQESDDEFDQAKLTDEHAKQILHDEVIFLFNYFFLLICLL